MLLVIPVIAGLILYARDIMELVFGSSYLPGTVSLQLLAAALFFAIGNGIAVNCMNAPLGEERTSMTATICAAAANVLLNLFLIPVMQENGAAISTITAESLVLIICLARLKNWRKMLDLSRLGRQALQTGAGTIVLVAIRLLIAPRFSSLAARMIAAILLSVMSYGIVLLLLGNEYLKKALKH